jgi:hypothetical protein
LGLYLLLAVELTSLARAHISKRLWRRVHFASFALFAFSTLHALTAGTDRASSPFLLSVIATCGVVIALTMVRVVRSARPARPVARAYGATRMAPYASRDIG